MVSVLASSVVDHGFEPWSGQTKDNKIGFSTKYAALRRKSKDWLTRYQDNVSEFYAHSQNIWKPTNLGIWEQEN